MMRRIAIALMASTLMATPTLAKQQQTNTKPTECRTILGLLFRGDCKLYNGDRSGPSKESSKERSKSKPDPNKSGRTGRPDPSPSRPDKDPPSKPEGPGKGPEGPGKEPPSKDPGKGGCACVGGGGGEGGGKEGKA